MIDTATPADQRPAFPRWSLEYQDQWLDLLEAYSVALLGREDYPAAQQASVEVIRHAAVLADAAVQETQYRFWIQRKARGTAKMRSGQKVGKRRRK